MTTILTIAFIAVIIALAFFWALLAVRWVDAEFTDWEDEDHEFTA